MKPLLLAVAYLALAFLVTAGSAHAQGVITGTVVDSTDGSTLPGANVQIVETQQGASAGPDGEYRIDGITPGTYTVRASFIGYEPQTREGVEVGNGETVTVSFALPSSSQSLDEVVVVGYGTERREDVTGSISSVTAEDLEDDQNATIDQALQGRVAGVTVERNTGRPGGDVSIRVRGLSTINTGDTEPLYIIDGVPINGSSDNGITNPLGTINPQDIESIDILKDASATAIYGSRASNGVVLITTKSGKAGEVGVDYNASVGVQSLPKRVDVLNLREFAQIKTEWAALAGYNNDRQLADPSLLGEGTDWQNQLFRSAARTNHTLAVSGGTEDTQFRISGGYTFQDGIAIESDFKRYSLNARLNNETTSWMTTGGTINLSRTIQNINISDDDIVNLTIRQSPDVAAVTPTGGYGGPEQAQFEQNNPLGLAQLNTNIDRQFQTTGGAYANIEFTDNLTLNNEINLSYSASGGEVFRPTFEFGAIQNQQNNSSRSAGSFSFWQVRNYVNYITSVSNLGIDLTGGHEVQESSYTGLNAARRIFPSNTVTELGAGDPETATNASYAGSSSLESFFGRVRLDYDNRYLLTSNFRADASSNFSPENRWGYFPSLAGAWKIQEEAFMDNVDFVSQLKLRLGWGEVGNQSIGQYSFGDTYTVGATDFGNGVRAGGLGNPGVKWETTRTTNLGIDLGLLDERLSLTVDAYLSTVNDLLLSVELPGYTGTRGTNSLGQPVDNIGSLENRGLEFSLNTINLTGDETGFRWGTDFVLSLNQNKVTALNTENAFLDASVDFGSTVITRTAVGQPAAQFYGYKVAGMFMSEDDLNRAAAGEDGYALPEGNSISQTNGTWIGDLRFEDINGDGVIDENDRTFIGNPSPDFQFGFTNRFSYKNFDLSIFLNGNYGNEILSQVRRDSEWASNGAFQFGNALASTLDYARIVKIDEDGPDTLDNLEIANPGTTVPRLEVGDPNNNQRVSDRFVEDGSYLRLQNLTLGYELPANLTNRFSLQRLRVFATASNLFTITGYSGYDPEIGEAQSSSRNSTPNRALLRGYDRGRYPSPRSFTLGLNVSI